MKVHDVSRSEGEPHDRLTRIAERCSTVLDAEGEDIRALILVDDEHRGGLCVHAYDNDMEALEAILRHASVLAQTMGIHVRVGGPTKMGHG